MRSLLISAYVTGMLTVAVLSILPPKKTAEERYSCLDKKVEVTVGGVSRDAFVFSRGDGSHARRVLVSGVGTLEDADGDGYGVKKTRIGNPPYSQAQVDSLYRAAVYQ